MRDNGAILGSLYVTPRPEATREVLPNLPESPSGPPRKSGSTARGKLRDEREARGDLKSHGHLRRGRGTNPEEVVRPEATLVLPRPDPREVVEG